MNIRVPHLRVKVKDEVCASDVEAATLDIRSLSMAAIAANTSAFAELNSVWNKYLGRDISAQLEVSKSK